MKLTALFEALLHENKIEHVTKTYGPKLQAVMDNDHFFQAQFQVERRRDPTVVDLVKELSLLAGPNGKHLVWVARQYASRKFRMEDSDRVATAIEQFEHLQQHLPNKDLNTYASLADLEDALEAVAGKTSKRQQKQEIKKEGVTVISDTPAGTVLKLETEAAAKYYGKGTRWCTAAERNNMFSHYRNRGDLYVILYPDGRKHQYFVPAPQSGYDIQFMDERDVEVPTSVQQEAYKTVPGVRETFLRAIEQVLDDHNDDSEELERAVTIAISLREPHPELERAVRYQLERASKSPMRLDEDDTLSEVFLEYIVDANRGRIDWYEDILLDDSIPYMLADYALRVIGGRWEEAESHAEFKVQLRAAAQPPQGGLRAPTFGQLVRAYYNKFIAKTVGDT